MPRPKIFITSSPSQTRQLGRAFGKKLRKGAVIALTGTLGSGKTTFVQGLALGLGLRKKIISPTFIIMVCRPIPKTPRVFYHLDLYRVGDKRTIQELGLSEIVRNPQNIIAIEWPEKFNSSLPIHTQRINFAHDGRNPKARIIKFR